MNTNAIIVDDEPNLVDYLTGKLAKLWPELTIIGTAHNGQSAIALANEVQPDIAFLDIKLPNVSGLQVAEALPAKTKVVFITAYDEFAVDAFQRAALDYLLKPVSDARLRQTIVRLKERSDQNREELVKLLRSISEEKHSYLQWIRAGLGDTTELISVQDIIYCKAEHKYTSVITRHRNFVIRRSIKDLEQQLDPNRFWRIHRGLIVRVDQIQKAQRDLRGCYTITLRDCPDILRSSRNYGKLFKLM